jgi:hypothetical protein
VPSGSDYFRRRQAAEAQWNHDRGRFSLCMINGKTLNEGESAKVPIDRKSVLVHCLKIQKDSVLILIEGEDAPRSLGLM